jgi:hypothetical protein
MSLGDRVSRTASQRGIMLDGLLRRPVDFSARTRLVAEQTPGLDVALIPVRIAWELFLPLVIRELKRSGKADTIESAKKAIERRDEDALAALEAVCEHACVLAACESGPWPLVAFRVRLTHDLAFAAHPSFLDAAGWGNLGKDIRLFSVLLEDAQEEALERLLPSRLLASPAVEGASEVARRKQLSPFSMVRDAVVPEVAVRALLERSLPLGLRDHLVLCDRRVLDAPTVP